MDEDLIVLATEDIIDIDAEEVVKSEVETIDLEQDIEIDETIENIEVETVEEIEIEVDETVGWVGGDSTRHYSLYGRDEVDQHPITAITGLREELNDIEALGVVYSNERNQADYYLWEDKNLLSESRIGYFVRICPKLMIEICTSDSDIFGVTVDGAGFVGAQADITRDEKYGLVVYSGVAHVRCESSVEVGDYVISNDYGYAQKNKDGYKVVGKHQINGEDYAEITLVAPLNRLCKLSDDVEDVNKRMDDAEKNIVSAINVANEAYNKASSIDFEGFNQGVTDAINKADEALKNSEDAQGAIQDAIKYSTEAQAKSDAALVAAETIRTEAVEVANTTLAEVNDLIKDLEPISTWRDPETGNIGAEYLTTYIENGVATKAEVYTVDKKTEDNKSAITKSADKIQTMVSSVDKYSVGEYSQAYGLTREQAKSILKKDYIYVPTKHSATISSHSEIFLDEEEPNEFTPHYYYTWDGTDWIESGSPLVAFFSEEPTPSRVLKYWYIDSNQAPEGYEPHALYMWENEEWQQVSLLSGNANNRVSSMIRQTANEIAAEVINARGSYAGLGARLEADNKAQVSLVASVVNTDGTVNTASIVNSVNESGSTVTLNGDHIILNGATTNGNGTFSISTEGHMTATGGDIAGWKIGGDAIFKAFDTGNVQIHCPSGIGGLGTGTNAYDFLRVAEVTEGKETAWPFVVTSDGSLKATKARITGNITAETFTATSGDNTKVTMEDNQLRLYYKKDNSNEFLNKPVISFGYPTKSKIPYLALGAGPTDSQNDYAGRFYISKNTSGGILTYYQSNTETTETVGSEIRLMNASVQLVAEGYTLTLGKDALKVLNDFIAEKLS